MQIHNAASCLLLRQSEYNEMKLLNNYINKPISKKHNVKIELIQPPPYSKNSLKSKTLFLLTTWGIRVLFSMSNNEYSFQKDRVYSKSTCCLITLVRSSSYIGI